MATDTASAVPSEHEQAATSQPRISSQQIEDQVEANMLNRARWRESDGHPLNRAALDLMKLWGEQHVF